MLDQVIVSCPKLSNIRNQLPDHVKLVVAGEDQALLFDDLLRAIRLKLLLFSDLQMDELLQNVHHAVFLEDFFPEIGSRISIRIGRIAFAAVTAGTVAALVKRKEISVLASKLCGHPDFCMIYGKVAQDPFVELEADLTGIPVIHPLPFGIVYCLAGVLVLQFKGKDRNAVQYEHHVHTFLCIGTEKPLPVAGYMIFGIQGCSSLVQRGFRLEVADPEGNAPMFEAMTQNRDKTAHIAGIIEGNAEFALGIDLICILEASPFLGLSLLDEVNQGMGIESELWIIGIGAFNISASRREE